MSANDAVMNDVAMTQFFVKLPNNETLTMHLPSDTSVETIREEVCKKIHTHAPTTSNRAIILKTGTSVLSDDDATIADIGITNQQTIDVSLGVPGGCAVDCCGCGCACTIL